MNRLGSIAYAAAIAGIALLTAREVIETSVYVIGELTLGMVVVGASGWSIATLGPLALSIWFWRLARRRQPQWVLHLLFIPCAIALVRAGASILFYAADVPDADSIEGRTLITAFGFLVLTLLVHAAALAAIGVARISRTANVR